MNAPTLLERAGAALHARLATLAEAITARHYALAPELDARYGPIGREKCLQDAAFHLSYLAEAISAGEPGLFKDYVAWAKVMLAERGVPASDLARNLNVLRDVVSGQLEQDAAALATAYIDGGISALPAAAEAVPTFIDDSAPLHELASAYLSALLRGERRVASRLVLDAVQAGTSIRDIYLHVFQRSQHEIGRLWQINAISVAQEHYATASTQLVMSQLYPQIFATERRGRSLVATCVSGDLHEIGVRMVSDFFELEGWDTFYLGANVPAASIVQTLNERRADVLAVSATITPHVRAVKELIGRVRASADCACVKIIVGGYPFNIAPELWRQIGADACARDALDAVAVANRLVGAE